MKKKTIWGNHLKLDDKKKESAKANIRFCAARDVASVPMADEKLVVWDLWTNYAHCQMLAKQKIINNQEWQKLKQGFYEIFKLHSAGKFSLDPELEDVHINIENYITFLGEKIFEKEKKELLELLTKLNYPTEEIKILIEFTFQNQTKK